MALRPLLVVCAAVVLFSLLLAYWRTLWVGRKYRIPVFLCSVVNSGSLAALLLVAKEVWQTRTWQSFGLLAAACTGYLLTEWWKLRLTRQQQEDSAADRRTGPRHRP